MTTEKTRPEGLAAIDREMARQHSDALASFEASADMATKAAASLKRTGRLLLLGMGGSHAVNRAVEPLYRAAGIDAIALPLSEQLGQPLPLDGRTIFMTSQSGESAEVVRWFNETGGTAETFGLTLEGTSFLAKTAPSLVGAGGTELAFAATRSLTVSFALHLAIFAGSRNRYLAAQARNLRLRLHPYRCYLVRMTRRIAAAHVEHDDIVQAIVAGDGERAFEAMRAHLAWDSERLADLTSTVSRRRHPSTSRTRPSTAHENTNPAP